jgi:hypothetical protein
MERSRSEPIFVCVDGIRERCAAIAERSEFIECRAFAIGARARRYADSTDSASANGAGLEHEHRIGLRAGSEFEQRRKQHSGENSTASEFAAFDVRVQRKHLADAVAITVADLQRECSGTTLCNHRLDQFGAFERHF